MAISPSGAIWRLSRGFPEANWLVHGDDMRFHLGNHHSTSGVVGPSMIQAGRTFSKDAGPSKRLLARILDHRYPTGHSILICRHSHFSALEGVLASIRGGIRKWVGDRFVTEDPLDVDNERHREIQGLYSPGKRAVVP